MKYIREFYGDVIIDKNTNEELLYNSKIKLSYYKITNDNTNPNKEFGIGIIKQQTNGVNIKIEKKEVVNFTCNEKDVNTYLDILKNNMVTPVTLIDVIEDLEKKNLYNKFSEFNY